MVPLNSGVLPRTVLLLRDSNVFVPVFRNPCSELLRIAEFDTRIVVVLPDVTVMPRLLNDDRQFSTFIVAPDNAAKPSPVFPDEMESRIVTLMIPVATNPFFALFSEVECSTVTLCSDVPLENAW